MTLTYSAGQKYLSESFLIYFLFYFIMQWYMASWIRSNTNR